MTKTSAGMNNKSKRKSDELPSTKTTAANEIFASCNFASLGLSPSLSDQLKERLGFASPTQVQAQAIPVILSGRHVLVNAVTGSGKTIAYLAPIIHHLHKYDPKIQRSDGTFALVLVPTRELCLQVYEILQKLLHRFHWIVPGYIMGGENRAKEKARLRKGISILIATPGRLLDHLRHTSSFSHANLRWLIFDEADRILELGFGKDIEEILEILGSRQNRLEGKGSLASTDIEFQRQNVLLSATLNEKVNHLANISLENPVMVGLDEKAEGSRHVSLDSDDEDERCTQVVPSSDGDYKLPPQLVQRYVKVPCGARLAVFLSILKNLYEREAGQKAVVFFSTRDAVDFHYSLLCGLRWPPSNSENESKELFFRGKTFRLHGKMAPEDRRTTFQTFKMEKSALLLCTDIAARGLDFPKVRCIVQYDSPGEASEYVHRVGRTARIGQRGDSLLFLQPVEADYLKELEKHGVSLSEYPLVKVLNSFPLPAADPKHHAKKFVAVDMHPWVMSLQRALESYISAEPTMMKLAKDAFLSWVRAYTAHRGDLKQIFMVKKLHLGHVAKSFALKEQPSLVGGSFQKQVDKRKRLQKKQNPSGSKRRKISSKA